MSRVSIVQTSVSGIQIVNDYFVKMSATSPAMAEYLKNLDFVPLVKECCEGALDTLSQQGISARRASGTQRIKLTTYDVIGVIGRSGNNLNILIDNKGNIKCYARTSEGGESGMKAMEKLFQQAFKQEVMKAAVEIMEYQTTFLKQEIRNTHGVPELVMQMEVEK